MGVACDPSPLSPQGEGQGEGWSKSEGWPSVLAETAWTWTAEVPIARNLAHVYTECARIFNPIHTDIAYAKAAGLPDIILHGTATLALSISRALRAFKADPLSVRRVQCRFSGMVLMPSTLKVQGARSASEISFETRRADGELVLSRGRIVLDG